MVKEIKYTLVTDVQMANKIGFIGYRNHAKKLINIIHENSNFEISHIYHPSKKIDGLPMTNNLEGLYDCDGIIISSPNRTHFGYIKQIIENSNAMIFCEKPPVTSSEGIYYLENMREEDKKRIFFNFNLRYSRINGVLKEFSNSEKVGKIIQINIITSQGLAFKDKYLTDWRSDGTNNLHNIIENSAIHWIDLMVNNFGKASKATQLPRLISKNGTSYDTNSINLEFEGGIGVSIFTSYATPLIDSIIIIGTNGLIILEDEYMNISYPRDTFDDNGLFKKPEIKERIHLDIQSDFKDSITNSVNYFLEHLRNSQKFDIDFFNTCVYSNKLVLDIEKK